MACPHTIIARRLTTKPHSFNTFHNSHSTETDYHDMLLFLAKAVEGTQAYISLMTDNAACYWDVIGDHQVY